MSMTLGYRGILSSGIAIRWLCAGVLLLASNSMATTRLVYLTLKSRDFSPGGEVPLRFRYPRCGGRNISPQLSWSVPPSPTRSLVLTMVDVDVQPSQWSHWVVVDLPARTLSLDQGMQVLPGKARQVTSNFGDKVYAGPCPPQGTGVHRYQFSIWAMPTAMTSVAPSEKASDLLRRLERTSIAHASAIGWVRR